MATKEDKTTLGKSHYSWFIANIASILGREPLYSESFRQSGLYNYQWKIKCQLITLKKHSSLLVELIQWNHMNGEVKVQGSISAFLQILDANQRVLRFYVLEPSNDQNNFKVQISFDFQEKLTVEGGIFIRCWITELSTNRELSLKNSSNTFQVKQTPIFRATKTDEHLKILGRDNLLSGFNENLEKSGADSYLSKDLYKNSNENALANDYQSKTKSLVLKTNPITNASGYKLRSSLASDKNGPKIRSPMTLEENNGNASYPIVEGTMHYGSKQTILEDYGFKSEKNQISKHIDLTFNMSDRNSNPLDTKVTISKENALANDYQSKTKSQVIETNLNFETKLIANASVYKRRSSLASDKNGNHLAEISNATTPVANNQSSSPLDRGNHYPLDESPMHYVSKPYMIPEDYGLKSEKKIIFNPVDLTFDKHDIPYFGKHMFDKQWGTKFRSDIVIVTKQRLFYCHKIILSSESLILKDWFQKNKSRILDKSDTFDDETISDLLHYIYTREAPNIRKTALDLMRISLLYDMSELKNLCINAMV